MKKLFAMGFMVAISIVAIGCSPDPRDFESHESVEELELETDEDVSEYVKSHGIYTRPATVIGVHDKTVTFEDSEGWTWGWSISNDREFSNGDFVALLMYSDGSESIFDDIILDVAK